MSIPEAKQYIGKNCAIRWSDRRNALHTTTMVVEDLQFVPLYGAYIIGQTDEILLDKVMEIRAVG